jgi:para-aminobenzoate synthetase / 4-amino-4-deoxychorismate lyase
VFETLLILDGAPIEIDVHLERMGRSVRELFAAELPPEARGLALDRAAPHAVGRLRLTVAPRRASGGLSLDAVAAAVDPADLFPSWQRAVALCPLVIPGGLGAHKWADRAALARTGSSERQDCLPLVLDAGGEALEASRANVFAVEGDVIVTPAADGRILPGVARARAIEAASSLGIEVREETLTVARLIAAGETFLTGSVRGLEPVSSVDGVALSAPGEAAAEIAAQLRRRWIATGAGRRTPAS